MSSKHVPHCKQHTIPGDAGDAWLMRPLGCLPLLPTRMQNLTPRNHATCAHVISVHKRPILNNDNLSQTTTTNANTTTTTTTTTKTTTTKDNDDDGDNNYHHN